MALPPILLPTVIGPITLPTLPGITLPFPLPTVTRPTIPSLPTRTTITRTLTTPTLALPTVSQSTPTTETTSSETLSTTSETSTPPPETTEPPPPPESTLPPSLPDTTSSDAVGLGPSVSPGLNAGSGAQVAPKGFFANKGAVTGTFTVVGVIVAALALAFIMMAVRRRRVKRLDQEVAEAAAIQRGFGVGFPDDDDDRRPLGGAAVYARPSMSTTAHRVSTHESGGYGATAPSAYSGYSNGYQVQYAQPIVAPYAYAAAAYPQQPQPPAEPDVYAYNPGDAAGFAGVGAGAGHPGPMAGNGPTAAHFAQQHPAALQPGMSRYAQMQQAQAAAQAADMRQRTPSPPAPAAVAAPAPAPVASGAPSAYAPPAAPQRAPSATSMQDYQDYASRMDLKLVNG